MLKIILSILMILQDQHLHRHILQHQDYLILMYSLASEENYYGYVVKGATIIGETSGAVAKITSIDLISDNWGDIIGSFFFRDANVEPKPPKTFRSGAKTFRITAATEGVIQINRFHSTR